MGRVRLAALTQGTGPTSRKDESRERDPLFKKDTRHGIGTTREWLGRELLLPVTATLQGDGDDHDDKAEDCQQRGALEEGDDKADIAQQEERNDDDVNEQIRS